MDIFLINVKNFTEISFYWQTIIFIFIGYFIGSINFGHIISKFKNKDLGDVGSKNYGATNAGRNFGIKGFIFVFAGDFLKIWVASAIMMSLFYTGLMPYGSIGLGLFFGVLGHNYPVWFNFKGGKGVASFIAATFVINYFAAIIGLLFFLIALILFRKVSLSSISFSIFASVFVLIFPFLNGSWIEGVLPSWSFDLETIIASFLITILVIYAHRSNIKNWYVGEERNIRLVDQAVHSWKERIRIIYDRSKKNFISYYSNTKTLNQDFILSYKIKKEEEEDFINNSQTSSYNLENIFVQHDIKNKKEIKIKNWKISPTTKTNYIFKLNNIRKMFRFKDKKISLQILDLDDLNYVIKNNNAYDLICEIDNNFYFANRLIQNDIKTIKLNATNQSFDKKENFYKILKLIQKTNSIAFLNFDFTKINEKILLKDYKLDPEEIFINEITYTISKIINQFENMEDKLIISIDFNPQIDILKIINIISVIYDYPIILNIGFNYWQNQELQIKLRSSNLINYLNIY